MLPSDISVLYFVAFLYWPLFFVNVRNLYSRYEMTRKKLGASLVLAGMSAALFSYAMPFLYPTTYVYLMLASAAVPVALMLLLGKARARRTKIKLIILSVYLHVFWQLLPGINIYTIAADLAAAVIIFMIAKMRTRRHRLQDNLLSRGSISKLWE